MGHEPLTSRSTYLRINDRFRGVPGLDGPVPLRFLFLHWFQ